MSKSYVKYIPLLCRIWPDFVQKSSLFCQQSLGIIQTRVPNFLDDKIRATVQLITYTVPQNCLSMFTIHCNSQFPYVQLMSVVELSAFFFEGHHLSKIRLGANVTDINCKVLSSIYPVLNSSSPISSSHSCYK